MGQAVYMDGVLQGSDGNTGSFNYSGKTLRIAQPYYGDIAEILGIEEKTVKNHINNIYSKLQIKSRYEAISYMLRGEG